MIATEVRSFVYTWAWILWHCKCKQQCLKFYFNPSVLYAVLWKTKYSKFTIIGQSFIHSCHSIQIAGVVTDLTLFFVSRAAVELLLSVASLSCLGQALSAWQPHIWLWSTLAYSDSKMPKSSTFVLPAGMRSLHCGLVCPKYIIAELFVYSDAALQTCLVFLELYYHEL